MEWRSAPKVGPKASFSAAAKRRSENLVKRMFGRKGIRGIASPGWERGRGEGPPLIVRAMQCRSTFCG